MKKANRFKIIIEYTLFSSKWMLIPFYLVLIIALANFIRIDVKEVYHFLIEETDSKSGSTMFILELIDMAMIAALVIMIIKGGYTSFVCKNHNEEGEKTSSGVLKVKLSTAIIGVSSINLLQTFMAISNESISKSLNITWEIVEKQLAIHAFFLMGAMVLSVIEYFHVKSEAIHNDDCQKHQYDKKPCRSNEDETCK